VFNIEYRRVDEDFGVWPQMASDVLHAAGLAVERPRVVIGHSAGGHLALWLSAQPGQADAVLALAPLADLTRASSLHLSTDATSELFGGPVDALPDVYASASPVELVPLGVPTVVVHGDADDAVPRVLSDTYVEAAIEAGDDVRYLMLEGVDHMQVIDPAHALWRELDAILELWATEL
jgi:dipeptidyl aminopeptidase/acylaminoacyl peptidase